jgi:hypothetical protein
MTVDREQKGFHVFGVCKSGLQAMASQRSFCAASLVVRKMFGELHAPALGSTGRNDDHAPHGPPGRTGCLPIIALA